MPIPSKAILFDAVMDPSDTIDYRISLTQGDTGFLQTDESVSSFSVVLMPEAVAAGLQIKTTEGYATILNGSMIQFWLTVVASQQTASIFVGDGVSLSMELTVKTNSNPQRTKQRTLVVKVAQL